VIRLGASRSWASSAAVLDGRPLTSTTSSEGAAYDGAKRVKRRKMHLAVDALGHLLAAAASPRAQLDAISSGHARMAPGGSLSEARRSPQPGNLKYRLGASSGVKFHS
jgi:hypothetical protein